MDMKPADIEKALKTGKLNIAVVGAGRIGLPTAVLFAKAGAKVTACDIDPKVVTCITNGENYIDEPGLDELFEAVIKSGNLTSSLDTAKTTSSSDAIIISVPTPVTKDKVPDYEHILAAVQDIGKGLQSGSIVVVESTIGPGTLETLIIPVIEKASGLIAGKDFLAASCPERADPGSIITRFRSIPRIIGGYTEQASEVAAAIYRPLAEEILIVPNPKTANAVKLTENIFRDVNIALMSELAILYERLGISIFDVIQGAATKWNFIAHYPGAGVGGPCLPANAYYIIAEGHKVGYVPYLVRMSREINDRMPHELVRHTMEALNRAGKSLKGAKVAILGLTYKPGVADVQMSPALTVIAELVDREAELRLSDPILGGTVFCDCEVTSDPLKAVKGADCVLLITAHEEYKQLKLENIASKAKAPLVLVDGRAVYHQHVKPKDTIYQGIGLPPD
ncbi:MAG: nucleotide sugar dehydrogenase [Promethearchaeota archaeon]